MGKTRSLAEFSQKNTATRISAWRSLTLPENVTIAVVDENSFNVRQANADQSPQNQANDYSILLQKIATDRTEFLHMKERGQNPPNSLGHGVVWDIFEDIFPERTLGLKGGTQFHVQRGGKVIPPDMWSDGERTAFYITAKISTSHRDMIIADEPTTYLHELLAVRLWRSLIDYFPDKRFLLSTHDVRFAQSFHPDFYLIADSYRNFNLIQSATVSDLAACDTHASPAFLRCCKKIVYCEGTETSRDVLLYSKIASNDVQVQPVGSCENVISSVRGLVRGNPVEGLEVSGIVDRDWGQDRDDVNVLSFHDVEAELCNDSVFGYVAETIGQPQAVQEYGNVLQLYAQELLSDPTRIETFVAAEANEAFEVIAASAIHAYIQQQGNEKEIALSHSLDELRVESRASLVAALNIAATECQFGEMLKKVPCKALIGKLTVLLGLKISIYIHVASQSEYMRDLAISLGLRTE